MYFYDSTIESMDNNTLKIDNFFRNKYDLNKKYTKIDHVNKVSFSAQTSLLRRGL